MLPLAGHRTSTHDLLIFGLDQTACYANWAIEILAFIEQDALYRQYNQPTVNETTANNKVGQQWVKSYECPGDPLKAKLEKPQTGPGNGKNWMHGSYRCKSGRSGAIGRAFWDTFEAQFWPASRTD